MKTGIWIDTSKALIVDVENGQSELRAVDSEVMTRERIEGQGKEFGRFGDQYIDSDNQGRIEKQKTEFFASVINEVKNSTSLVIFGPAAMKNELRKAMDKVPGMGEKVLDVETADSMTNDQVVAWVREYFEKADA